MGALIDIFTAAVQGIIRILVGLLFLAAMAGGVAGILYYLSTRPNIFLTFLTIFVVVWVGWLAHAIGSEFLS